MAAQKKLRGVLFIEKNFCQIILENNSTVFTFQYPPSIIQDLEILQLEEFHKQFAAFLMQNKIPPLDYIMVLGNNLFFVKDIKIPEQKPAAKDAPKQAEQAATPPSEEIEIQKFLSHVPFENVSFKVFKKDQLVRILATNRDLFEAFKKAVEKQGGKISMIIPGFAFELYKNIKLGQSFTAESARLVFKDMDSIKEESMLVNQEPEVDDEEPRKLIEEEKSPIHDPKKRIWAFGGIFGLLLLVLGYLVVSQFVLGGNKKPVQMTQPTLPPVQVAEIQTPTPTTATLSAEMKQQMTVQILSVSSQRSAATDLREALAQLGYTNVRLGTTNTNSPDTQVIYKPSLDTLAKQEINTLMTELYPDNSVIENTDSQFDVNITLPSTPVASNSAQ